MRASWAKHYILDDEHHLVAVDLLTWARWFENTSNRRVAWTQVNSAITVSTVFLGLDHRFSGEGPPFVFETMVFIEEASALKKSDWQGWMMRYSSWDDAQTGHKTIVRKVREAIRRKVRS